MYDLICSLIPIDRPGKIQIPDFALPSTYGASDGLGDLIVLDGHAQVRWVFNVDGDGIQHA
jgi:hypothetical protein